MLLNELKISDERRIAKINRVLQESYGFSLNSDVGLEKIRALQDKVANELHDLKLNQSTAKDGAYIQKVLVQEGLNILANKLTENAPLVGPGIPVFAYVTATLSDFVRKACEIGDDYDEAIHEAMKQYRSSKYRFADEAVEAEIRKLTADCTLPPISHDAEMGIGGAGYNDTMGYNDDVVMHEGEEVVNEKAPPGMEDWVKSNKAKFKKEYGADKGEEVLYATAWKKHNESVGESIKEGLGKSILSVISDEDLAQLRKDYHEGGLNMSAPYYTKLYEYYLNNGEMPYGIAKARDGDPDQWIYNEIQKDFNDDLENINEANPDRYADREWAQQLAKEHGKKRASGDLDKDEDDSNDYFYHMAKKKVPATEGKTQMKEGHIRQLRKLLEAEVEQAESLIAAKSFSQELQDMVEKLGRLVNEDLPAVAEQMRDAYGADVATGFENSVSGTLNNVMDTLKTSKQELDNSVSSIASGGTPAASVDMDKYPAGDEAGADLDLDKDVDLDLGTDEVGGEDAAAGEVEEPLGRAKKESVENLKNKIAEAKEKIAKAKKDKEEKVDEKWEAKTKTPEKKKGMFKGKSLADLRSELANLKKSGPHKKGSKEYTKQKELNFAIRAKTGWGKVGESIKQQIAEVEQKLAEAKKAKKSK